LPVLYGWLDQPPMLGVTLHWIDASIDTGPIVAREGYQPLAGETILHMMSELHDQGMRRLAQMLPQIQHGATIAEPQSGGSYERLPSREVMQSFRRRGGRLVGWKDVVRAMRTPIDG
jgi:hypothetical protein